MTSIMGHNSPSWEHSLHFKDHSDFSAVSWLAIKLYTNRQFTEGEWAIIKDALNEFLPGLTGEKLNSEKGRDEMRVEVIKKIHELFPEEEVPGGDPWPIRELLFDEFVLTLAY